ncbi:MAG: pilus assembly protein [Casimicrobium sp.]
MINMMTMPAFLTKVRALLLTLSVVGTVVWGSPTFGTMTLSPYVSSAAKAPPLVLLTMGRDEKLVAPAYNDYSDIDGDGLTDIGYKTNADFKYFGNFSSELCYTYDTTRKRFEPSARTTTKRCSGAWSGDFLNYVTTSRIDALRRSLYGGKRVVDTEDETVIERANVPHDSHVWGKEYDPAIHTYSITDYTPLAQPAAGRRHLFANVTLLGTTDPLLRVLTSRTERIWNWVLKETPVGSDNSLDNRNGSAVATNYVLRTLVCVRGNMTLRELDCKEYPGSGAGQTYKPTGILHDYGESRTIAFGLLTGTYANARSGGALRRNIEFFDSEIFPQTGIFRPTVLGIVNSIDRIRVAQFSRGGNYHGYDCNPRNKGDCIDFVNPVSEMMYEGLRYLASGTGPVTSFKSGALDTELGLGEEVWKDPYRSKASGGFPACSKPIQMVVSDIKPTFDSDDLPGTSFPTTFTAPSGPASLSALNVSTVATSIWGLEGLPSAKYFIGESLSNTPSFDQSPSLKTVTSFANIRGLAPEVPTRQGSYYSASVAKYGKDTNLAASGASRNVDTYAIALSTPLPSLNIPVGGGTVKIIPVGQSLVGCSFGGFQQGSLYPANRIVGFYIEDIVNVAGYRTDAAVNGGRPKARFRVGFEDNEEGTDNDMDAIVIYDISVTADGRVSVRLDAEYAAGCIGQHLGFVISGTTEDGKYLGVRDPDTPCSVDQLFPLLGDDVANSSANTDIVNPPKPQSWVDNRDVCRNGAGTPTGLGTRYNRTFTPSGNNLGGNIPKDPLWYSVKYGGPKAPLVSGDNPEGYFLVTNPALLRAQLSAAFATIVENLKSGRSSLRFTGAFVRTNTRVYAPRYEAGNWAGALEAYRLDTSTGEIGARIWTTADSEALRPPNAGSLVWQSRRIFTEINGALQPLTADNVSDPIFSDSALISRLVPSSIAGLYTPAPTTNVLLKRVVDFIRGDTSNEQKYGGKLRSRGAIPTAIDPTAGGLANVTLGSVVNTSIATQIGQDDGYGALIGRIPEAASYRAYVATKATKPKVIYFGSNDGLLHALEDDANGREAWAFMPRAAQQYAANLANPGYSHRYTVDGPIVVGDYYDGGWKTVVIGSTGAGARSVYALDVTDPLSPVRLWEFSGASIPELGHVLSGIRILRDAGGTWVAVFGNGYKSSATAIPGAALIAIPLKTGVTTSAVAKITVPAVTSENGLGPLAALSPSGIAVRGWAGDLNGTIWRFDLSGNYTAWKLSTKSVLFRAERSGVKQPITTEPSVVPSSAGGYLIYVGTGKFFEDEDTADRNVQSFYAIYDSEGVTASRSNMTQYVIQTNADRRTVARNGPERVDGFYIDLIDGANARGERIVANPLVFLGLAFFNSVEINSDDPCLPSLSGWQMVLNAFTGENPPIAVFDAVPPTGGAPFTAGVSGPGSLGSTSVISTVGGKVTIFTGNETISAGSGRGNLDCRTAPNSLFCQSLLQKRTAWRRAQ